MSMSGRKDHGVVGSMGLERKEGVITLQERGGMSILSGKGGGMKYISGQKMIQPDSAVFVHICTLSSWLQCYINYRPQKMPCVRWESGSIISR